MRTTRLLAVVGLTVVLAGCGVPADDPADGPATTSGGAESSVPADDPATGGEGTGRAGDADALLAEHGLAGLGPREVIDELDRVALADRSDELIASVRVDQLLLSDADQEVAVDLPEDDFYLSIAPYVDGTHDCFYHSLTTCRGELGGEQVHVRIVDDAGEVLVDEDTTTFDNGFVGYWLPRDVEATLTVTYDGKRAEAEIGTGEDDPTCLTTLKLA